MKQSDSGLYRVVLENDLGRIEASARLEVIAHRSFYSAGLRARSSSPRPAPTYRRTYNTSSARYGSNARLFYDIRGVPTPFLKWYKDGVPLEASQKREIYMDGDGFHLDIGDVDESDGGVYSVKDDQNMVDYRNELEVVGVPERKKGRIEEFSGLEGSFESSKKQKTALVADEHDNCLSKIKKIDEALTGVDEVKNEQNLRESLGESNAAEVSQKANANLQSFADDFSPPKITRRLPALVKTREGGPTFLEVFVEGAGPFDAVWMKDGCVLPDCEDFRQEVNGGAVSLLIADTFPEDCGRYTCEVYSVFGEDVSRCTVEVEGELEFFF